MKGRPRCQRVQTSGSRGPFGHQRQLRHQRVLPGPPGLGAGHDLLGWRDGLGRVQDYGRGSIRALWWSWQERPERALVRPRRADADLSLVWHDTLRRHVPWHVVRIHDLRAPADRLGCLSPSRALVLRHYLRPRPPARLAEVERIGPIAVVRQFLLGQAPAAHRPADILRNPGIVGQEVHQTFLVGLLFPDDLATPRLGRLGIIVVPADVVGAERTMVVPAKAVAPLFFGGKNTGELVTEHDNGS